MGPNKPNGYYYYMQHQKKTRPGWGRKSNAELSLICSEGWSALSPEERARFKAMKGEVPPATGVGAKHQQRQKGEVNILGGYAANGVRLTDIVARDFQLQTREEKEQRLIRNFLFHANRVHAQTFFLIHCNHFGKLDQTEPPVYMPAEISVCGFSLAEGVEEVNHWFPRPSIPPIYKRRARESTESRHGIPSEDFEENYTEDGDILDALDSQLGRARIIFTLDEWREPSVSILSRLYEKDGREMPFSILSAEELLSQLCNLKSTASLNAVQANSLIGPNLMAFHPDIDCTWHRMNVDSLHCSVAYVQRLVFALAGILCPLFNIPLLPGKHSLPLWNNVQSAGEAGAQNPWEDAEEDVQKSGGWAVVRGGDNFRPSGFGARDIRQAVDRTPRPPAGNTGATAAALGPDGSGPLGRGRGAVRPRHAAVMSSSAASSSSVVSEGPRGRGARGWRNCVGNA